MKGPNEKKNVRRQEEEEGEEVRDDLTDKPDYKGEEEEVETKHSARKRLRQSVLSRKMWIIR